MVPPTPQSEGPILPSRRSVLLTLALSVLVLTGRVEAQDRPWLLLAEAIPAVGVDLPHLDAAPYEEREALAEQVRVELVPRIAAAIGVPGGAEARAVTPGGWMLTTNPSIPVTVLGGRAAERMAAALGLVLRQSAVLTVDLADGQGGTGFGLVALPDGPGDPALAHQFFLHAAGVDRGLAGGYTALPVGMVFLNLRDGRGRPYGGIDDAAFADALRRAVTTFPGPALRYERSGTARALLIGNDWKTSPDGAAYRDRIADPAAVRRLGPIQQRHTALVLEAAGKFGWR